jgi:hypothetical protein
MLTPNLVHFAMLRLQTAVLRNRTVRIADGLRCPSCDTEIRACDPEETNAGVRIVCRNCHHDLFILERSY